MKTLALFVCLLTLAGRALAGPLPPPAASAGYDRLTFYSDFTDPYYTNLANWLDCAGAPSPQWWIGGALGGPPPPCSRISMTTEPGCVQLPSTAWSCDGTQVLDLKFTADDAANLALSLTSVNAMSGFGQGFDFPNEAYIEITFSVTPQTIDGNPLGAGAVSFWTWSDSYVLGVSSCFQEYDPIELYANGGDGKEYDDSYVHVNCPNQQDMWLDGWVENYEIDPRRFHTYGALIEQDNNYPNLSICIDIDWVQRRCNDMRSVGDVPNASQLNQRNYLVMEVGSLLRDLTPVSADMDLLVRDVQVWQR